MPHLTLARNAQRPPPPGGAPIEWPVDAFALMASELKADGPQYRILHETKLALSAAVDIAHAGQDSEHSVSKQG